MENSVTAVEPHIEKNNLWALFHKHLILELFDWLRERLGDDYLVDLESTVLLIPRWHEPVRGVSPDVEVSLWPDKQNKETAVVAFTPALIEVDEILDEWEQDAIMIRRRDLPSVSDPLGAQVVAALELLSPSNKGGTGARDRRKFLQKRNDYLASSVSYVEIDLLENGQRDLPQTVEQLETYPYLVWASQVQEQARHHWGWGWQKEGSLPAILVPLNYPHVHTLDLSVCYHRAYERNHWRLRLGD